MSIASTEKIENMKTITIFFGLLIGFNSFAQNGTKIIITGSPKQVPQGKIWKLSAGKETKVQIDKTALNSGSLCNAMFRSKPGIIFNINKGDLFNAESHGIIFDNFEEVPYTNDYTYILKPISIVDKSFKLEHLEYSKAEDIGSKELTFIEGEKVFVASCLQSIELTEFNISKAELDLEIKRRSQSNIESENSSAMEKRNKLINEQRLLDIQEKIKNQYIFEPRELDELPKFIGNREAILTYYKYSNNYRFSIFLLINEDGSFRLYGKQDSKFDSIIFNFLKFSPGYFLIDDEKYNVRTKIQLIFMERGITKPKDNNINVEIKKIEKSPYYKILSDNDSSSLNFVNSIVDFSQLVSNLQNGRFMFNISNEKVKADIYLNSSREGSIFREEFNIPEVKYVPSNQYFGDNTSNWKYIEPKQYKGYNLSDPKFRLGLKDDTLIYENKGFDIPINNHKYVEPGSKPSFHEENIFKILFSSNEVVFKYSDKNGLDSQSSWVLDLTIDRFLMDSNQGFSKYYYVKKVGYDEKMHSTKFELSESGYSITHDLYVSYSNDNGYSVVLYSRDKKEEFQFQDIKVTKKY